jgi:hypothetical protein
MGSRARQLRPRHAVSSLSQGNRYLLTWQVDLEQIQREFNFLRQNRLGSPHTTHSASAYS